MLRTWEREAGRWNPDGLALLRIFTALFIGLLLVPPAKGGDPAWIASVPPDFFAPPPGPLSWLAGFPPADVVHALRVSAMLSLVAMGVGWGTRSASLLAGITLLALQGLQYTVGKVNHEMVLPLVPLVFAFSGWGARWSVDGLRSDRARAGSPPSSPIPSAVPVLALLIGFMMFTAAVPKLLGGWLDPRSQAVLGHLLNQRIAKGRDLLLSGPAAALDVPPFWELADWATVAFELGFLPAVLHPKWFRGFVAAAVFFHLSTLLMLNIAFLPNFAGYAVFLNWGALARRVRRLSGRVPAGAPNALQSPPAWFAAGVCAFLLPLTLPLPPLAAGDLTLPELAIVGGSALWLATLGARRLIGHITRIKKPVPATKTDTG